MKNKTGIWIDYDKAFIIELKDQSEKIKRIDSNIEHFNVNGGSRSKTAYGPQDNVSESKYLARKQQQQKAFFSEVIDQLNPKSELVIFGPAEAKNTFQKAIQKEPLFRDKIIPVKTTDSMTENQMKAWFRNYTSEL